MTKLFPKILEKKDNKLSKEEIDFIVDFGACKKTFLTLKLLKIMILKK
jgi:hypothetical protein